LNKNAEELKKVIAKATLNSLNNKDLKTKK
jgi:hypothetical protein